MNAYEAPGVSDVVGDEVSHSVSHCCCPLSCCQRPVARDIAHQHSREQASLNLESTTIARAIPEERMAKFGCHAALVGGDQLAPPVRGERRRARAGDEIGRSNLTVV